MSDISEELLKIIKSEVEKAKNAGSDLEIESIAILEQKFSAFLEEKATKFDVGDVVKWKKGLKNKKYPKEGQYCMVVEELEQPIIQDTKDSGSPYYREPLDLVLALLDDDSDLLILHYDKRRFELVKKARKKE